jgi:hypothetical protein
MVRTTLPHVGLVGVGIVVAAVLPGCGTGSGGNTAQPASSSSTPLTSTVAGTTSPAVDSSTGESAVQPAPGDGYCKAADVKLALGRGEGSAGTVYRPLMITNVSSHKCVVHGFPGVSYVAGADGHQVGPAAYRDGTKGDPVSLNRGESASVDVGFVNVQNYDPAVCMPTPVNGIRVYLPQDTASKFVEAPGTGCASDKIPGNQLTVKTARKAPSE